MTLMFIPYIEKDKKHYHFSMILTITKNKNDKEKYISQINNYVKKQMKHGSEIKLKYYKILPKNLSIKYSNAKISEFGDCIAAPPPSAKTKFVFV